MSLCTYLHNVGKYASIWLNCPPHVTIYSSIIGTFGVPVFHIFIKTGQDEEKHFHPILIVLRLGGSVDFPSK